jgi:hypothetical protein
MIRWNSLSNACDVLGLGPRAAGRLASVGVRTVADLLAASPATLADRKYTDTTIAAWQCEARLTLAVPELGPATRVLAAIGIQSVEQLQRTSPFELVARCESLWQAESSPSWLVTQPMPAMSDLCRWIELAQEKTTTRAA